MADSFRDFLKSYYKNKEDQIKPEHKTNTRIGKTELSIYGGTYSIVDKKDYKTFLGLYANNILKKKRKEYLTEKQLLNDGPILIDLDFRYDLAVKMRQHTNNHIEIIVDAITDELSKIYQMDSSTTFKVFVLHKDDVNIVPEKQVTKDGIHIIITLKGERNIQNILRNQLLAPLSGIFEKLPLTNSIEDVYDDKVTAGSVNWQLFGSMKPGNKPYKLTHIYEYSVDEDDGELIMDQLDVEAFDVTDPNNLYTLSARNDEHPSLLMKSSFIPTYEAFTKTISRSTEGSNNNLQALSSTFDGSDRNKILSISNEADLKMLEEQFLNSLGSREFDVLIRETYEYTMALPKEYYDQGSFSKWIRVCWVLCNSLPKRDDFLYQRERLLFVWVLFSAQSSIFSFSWISELITKWDESLTKLQSIDTALTFRSLTYWVREDNPDEYKKIHSNTVDHYVMQTMYGITGGRRVLDENEKIGDEVFAELLYQLHKDDYVCVSCSKNKWYKYFNGRWKKDDTGVGLQLKITRLKKIFIHKIGDYRDPNPNEEQGENSNHMKVHKRLNAIINRLTDISFREKVFKGARLLFYDDSFVNKLDTNKDLVSFENGVVDISTGTFRKGRPDDYISLSTNINYIAELDSRYSDIINGVTTFLHQLYPEKDLYDYMLEHLASTMTGHNKRQNAHFYIGVGANGKSALLELMKFVLGDYYDDVPSSLIMDRRAKVGGTAPELVKLQGKRLAVIQEPSKDDVLNEGVFKQLTSSNDNIQARGLYVEEPISFKAQFKLVVATNYLMKINATDNGTWRRIAVVDHKSVFTDNPVKGDREKPYQFKVDREMTSKFVLWKEVFASMLVRKAIETGGDVNPCDQVVNRSKEYQTSQDSIAEFLHDKINQTDNKDDKISKTDLSSEFGTWHAATYGRGGPTARDLYDYFTKKFGRPKNGGWRGVRIVYGQETDDSSDEEDIDGDEDDFLS